MMENKIRLGRVLNFLLKAKRRSGKENAPHQTDIHHGNKIFQPPVFHLNIPGKP
jgi:hypothetical protein